MVSGAAMLSSYVVRGVPYCLILWGVAILVRLEVVAQKMEVG